VEFLQQGGRRYILGTPKSREGRKCSFFAAVPSAI
jgi:hypothetical protein